MRYYLPLHFYLAFPSGCARKPEESFAREESGTHPRLSTSCRRLVHNFCAQDVVRDLTGSDDEDFFLSEAYFYSVGGASHTTLPRQHNFEILLFIGSSSSPISFFFSIFPCFGGYQRVASQHQNCFQCARPCNQRAYEEGRK